MVLENKKVGSVVVGSFNRAYYWKSILIVSIVFLISCSSISKNDEYLLYSAAKGKTDIAQKLILGGANVNAQGDGGATPLMYAIRGGQKEMVELLLKTKGININLQDDNKLTALHYSILVPESRHDIFAILIKGGADGDILDANGKTVLMYLVEKDDLKAIPLLVKSGINIDATGTEEGITALMLSIFRDKIKTVKLLLKLKADPNVLSTKNKFSALQLAQHKKQKAMIAILKKYKAQ